MNNQITNFEFKAKVDDLEIYENKLLELQPVFIGLDHQIDTYFNANIGRLKLREGNIENALINYLRDDTANSKESTIILYKHQSDPALKAILRQQLGIKVVVDKMRKIYYIDNVKFHLDEVANLGRYIEVEAIDTNGSIPKENLQNQCEYYLDYFGINKDQLVSMSYSDLILENKD